MSDRRTFFFSKLCQDRRGTVAIMTALGGIMLIGATGLAVDIVTWEVDQHKMQTAADAGALAGAIAQANGEDVTSAVDAVTQSDGFTNGSGGVVVTVNGNTPATDDVQVIISAPQPQYFSRLLLASAPNVTVQAESRLAGDSGNMCVQSLDPSGKLSIGSVTFTGTTNVNLQNCDLYNNSAATNSTVFSGTSTLNVRNIFLVGGYSVTNNANVYTDNTAVSPPVYPIATGVSSTPDPYGQLAITASGGAITVDDPYAGITHSYTGCDQTNYSSPANQTVTISPGVYCGGITVNAGSTVNMQPGTYILDQGSFDVAGGGTIIGDGVTVILTSSTGSNYGTVTFNGQSTETLTAPSSGASGGFPGIALWVDKNAPTGTAKMNGGSTQNINGAIYLPSQQVQYSGGNSTAATATAASDCVQLVGLTVDFTGNSNFGHGSCSSLGIQLNEPQLPPVLIE